MPSQGGPVLRRLVPSALAGLLALTAGACAADDGQASGGSDTALDVVAAFYPLEFLATRVGGEQVNVTGLAPPGVEAHDLELSPAQVAEVSDADLVVYLSEFMPAVDESVEAHARESFDVAGAVPLLEATEDGGHGHEEEEDGHAEDEHGPEDPHLWLDPLRMATLADDLASRFGDLDPDNAADYTANAEALQADLEALDTEYTDGLAGCERREIVVSHAAFGYLADRYDLRQIAITGLTPETEPSPGDIEEVIHEAEEVGATTIFFEVLVSPDVAELIAREVGAQTAVLDPIEGLAPGTAEDYLSLMRQNLETLKPALGCP